MARVMLISLTFAIMFFVTLVLNTPLEIALRFAPLDRYQLDYSKAEGTIWQGQLKGVVARGQPLGDVRFKAMPGALFGGVLASRVQFANAGVTGSGRMGMGLASGALHFRDVRLSAEVRSLAQISQFLRQSGGRISGAVPQGEFQLGKGCRALNGTVSTDILKSIEDVKWQGPVINGQWSCADGNAVLRFAGDEAGEEVDGEITLRPDGMFELDLNLVTQSTEITTFLSAIGFENQNGRWGYRSEGRI
jgi:hypothetical protein